MAGKLYGLGILVGRFQTFHKGHEDMVDRALDLCEEVALFVGSSQEQGTETNPFSYETRAEMIQRVYGDRVQVWPLPDIGVGNVPAWGKYVIENVVARTGRRPDLFVSGKESRRASWLSEETGLSVSELYIPKTIEISASAMRSFLLEDRREDWQAYTGEALWPMYERLRAEVLASRGNVNTKSI